MVTYLPRSAWGAREPNGRNALVRSEVDGDVLHWPGMSSRIDAAGDIGARRVASALRGWQNYHMDDRGWSDIAYQFAIDQAGRAWTLRGHNIRSAANGDQDVNSRYGAILLVLGPGEEPSAAMKATVRGVIADFRKWFPAGTAIRPHSAVRPAGTDCPGDRARAAISRGDFTPRTEDDVTPEQMNTLLAAANAAKAAADKATAAAVAATAAAKAAGAQAVNGAEAAGRRWALYVLRYGLQTEDERAAALQVFQDRIKAGDTEEQAMAAAAAKLQALDTALKETQANG